VFLAVVHFLLEDSDPCTMTADEYVNIHELPFDIIMDSGKSLTFIFVSLGSV
jgi:hypothetical protein